MRCLFLAIIKEAADQRKWGTGKMRKLKSDDVFVLKEVQKNADMAMKAIDAISEKIDDDSLAVQLARENKKYSELYHKAADRLLTAGEAFYRGTAYQDMMLKGAVRANTLFNTSTSHMAELLIQGSNRGLTDMWKVINHNERAGEVSMEIARELMDFEEKNIERLKNYL